MKKINFILLFCGLLMGAVAQTNVELNIQHKFEKSTLILGQTYTNEANRVLQIDRVQYYWSGIKLVHDGGQITMIPNIGLLINGLQSNYSLGRVPNRIEALEKLEFNLGLNAITNLSSPMDYFRGEDLAVQSMYSNSQNSYIFVVIEGTIDSDGDQIPDKKFILRATDSQLLRQIRIKSPKGAVDGILTINLIADVSKWLKNIGLETVGLQENNSFWNQLMVDNTNDFSVFSVLETTAVEVLVSPRNHIYVDTRLSFSPSIHYKFYTNEQVDMTITNVTGTYFIQQFELSPEGNYYMNNDLASGLYLVIFTSPKGIRQCKRFTIIR